MSLQTFSIIVSVLDVLKVLNVLNVLSELILLSELIELNLLPFNNSLACTSLQQ